MHPYIKSHVYDIHLPIGDKIFSENHLQQALMHFPISLQTLLKKSHNFVQHLPKASHIISKQRLIALIISIKISYMHIRHLLMHLQIGVQIYDIALPMAVHILPIQI